MSGLLGARTCPGPGEASDLKSPRGARFREPLTEARFQQLFGDAEQEPELLAESRLSLLCRLWRRRARACSGPGAWRLLLARLPPLRWLPHYRWRAWLLGDAVAGVTVGIVHVPQGMAFALLTSVPPVFGLYTSFFPVLIYTLLGTGRHLSTGTFAVLSLMTGSAVERLVPEPLGGNLSGIEREQLDAQRVGAAAAMAFGSGALMLGMFALQLGVLSTFLSEPVVKALTSGAALHVLVSQLPSLLGLPLPRQIGCFALFKTLAAVLTALPRSNPAELTISALSLALLVPVKELNVRFRDRLPTPIPGEIVMVRMAPGSSPLPRTDPAHPLGTGRCRPLVECGEVTEGSPAYACAFPGLFPELFDPPESPTHTFPLLSRRPPLDPFEGPLPPYSAPLRCRSPQHLHSLLTLSFTVILDLPSHARLHFSLSSCLLPSNLLLLLPCPNLLSFPGASGLRALLHFFSGHKIQRADSGAAAWRISPTSPAQPG
uniref:SLC26A/SulP transporter domain-containing protein n=1 Tax=Equus asinus asinus TaxID=83772 RepID=A0A8C4LEV0_EQUAS